VAEVIRKMGITEPTFYRWKKQFAGARERIEDWRRDYNETRPHMALSGLTPSAFAQQPHQARKVA